MDASYQRNDPAANPKGGKPTGALIHCAFDPVKATIVFAYEVIEFGFNSRQSFVVWGWSGDDATLDGGERSYGHVATRLAVCPRSPLAAA